MKSFVIASFFPLCCLSQQPKPLSIGDTLPAAAWQQLSPSEGGVTSNGVTGEVISNRLILLDFFATWCSSCYKKFLRLDSLQKQFGNKFSVVLVNARSTGDDSLKLDAFFKKRKNLDGSPFCFPMIANDTVLEKLFPHWVIPHYVWIYNNKVVAITGSDQLKKENITAFLHNDPLLLPQKIDAPPPPPRSSQQP